MDGTIWDVRYWLNSNILVSSEGITAMWKSLFSRTFVWDLSFFGSPSYGESCKITVVHLSVRPSVCQSGNFLRNGLLVFSDFLHDCRWLEDLKTDNPSPRKFFFFQVWEKNAQNGHKKRILLIFKKTFGISFFSQ